MNPRELWPPVNIHAQCWSLELCGPLTFQVSTETLLHAQTGSTLRLWLPSSGHERTQTARPSISLHQSKCELVNTLTHFGLPGCVTTHHLWCSLRAMHSEWSAWLCWIANQWATKGFDPPAEVTMQKNCCATPDTPQLGSSNFDLPCRTANGTHEETGHCQHALPTNTANMPKTLVENSAACAAVVSGTLLSHWVVDYLDSKTLNRTWLSGLDLTDRTRKIILFGLDSTDSTRLVGLEKKAWIELD